VENEGVLPGPHTAKVGQEAHARANALLMPATTSALASSMSSSSAPIVHAIGGSVGSALALLLFYPLERARLEIQSAAANQQSLDAVVAVESSHERMEQNIMPQQAVVPERDAVSIVSTPSSGESSWSAASDRSHDSFFDASEIIYPLLSDRHEQSIPAQQQHDKDDTNHHHHNTAELSRCIRSLWQSNKLYQGVTPFVVTLAVSNFVFFYFNEWMKQVLVVPMRQKQQSPLYNDKKHLRLGGSSSSRYMSLLASCLAGTINVMMTNPLWLISTRISVGDSASSSLWTELWTVFRQQGLAHLWTGTGSSLLLVSNPVIQFFLYEQLKDILLASASTSASHRGSLSPVEAFCTGAVAKTISTVVTYPLQLTQSLLRLQRHQRHPPQHGDGDHDDKEQQQRQWQQNKKQQYQGICDCLAQIYKRDGPFGLYAGMRAKLLLTVLTAAFTFLTYEQILQSVHVAHAKLLLKKLPR
jgi:solute carrier family 25 (peroxisomal adenine nucleotide transporter), member 17